MKGWRKFAHVPIKIVTSRDRSLLIGASRHLSPSPRPSLAYSQKAKLVLQNDEDVLDEQSYREGMSYHQYRSHNVVY